MKLPATTLVLAVLGSAPSNAQPCDHYYELCGPTLRSGGWQEVARCHDGHTWAYVLASGDRRVLCRGINAYGGPMEFPCRSFNGDLERLRLMVAKGDGDVPRANTSCWQALGQQDDGVR